MVGGFRGLLFEKVWGVEIVGLASDSKQQQTPGETILPGP